eukprot:scaffold1425_cov333-Prasinococcus_capsulatus_cf.AAC.7
MAGDRCAAATTTTTTTATTATATATTTCARARRSLLQIASSAWPPAARSRVQARARGYIHTYICGPRRARGASLCAAGVSRSGGGRSAALQCPRSAGAPLLAPSQRWRPREAPTCHSVTSLATAPTAPMQKKTQKHQKVKLLEAMSVQKGTAQPKALTAGNDTKSSSFLHTEQLAAAAAKEEDILQGFVLSPFQRTMAITW